MQTVHDDEKCHLHQVIQLLTGYLPRFSQLQNTIDHTPQQESQIADAVFTGYGYSGALLQHPLQFSQTSQFLELDLFLQFFRNSVTIAIKIDEEKQLEILMVLLVKTQVGFQTAVYAFLGIATLVDRLFHICQQHIQILQQNLRVNFFLAFEMGIDGALAEFDFTGDIVKSHSDDPFLGKQSARRVEDQDFALPVFPLFPFLDSQIDSQLYFNYRSGIIYNSISFLCQVRSRRRLTSGRQSLQYDSEETMISEKGMLRDTPAIKLLLAIFEQRLTGILYLKRDDTLKVFYFNRGKFTWAISNADEDRLETLLIDRKLIDGDTVELFRKSVKAPESLGKTLVENGLLTLENLVAMTRAQLEKIVASVLSWTNGGFQFVRDTPPERLVSLDLEIPIMVHHCVQEYLEMDLLWKEIGTLQLNLQITADTAKLSLYPLSEHQKEIMAAFRQPAQLETILPRFAGTPKHSILKSIYFLLVSGLLLRTDPAPAPPPAAVPATKLKLPEPVVSAGESTVSDDEQPAQQAISIDLPPPEMEEEPLTWASSATLPQELTGDDNASQPPLPDNTPTSSFAKQATAMADIPFQTDEPLPTSEFIEEDFLQAELHGESDDGGKARDLPRPFVNTLHDNEHRHRLLRWTIILGIITLTAGGLYMLLLRSSQQAQPPLPDPAETVSPPPATRSVPVVHSSAKAALDEKPAEKTVSPATTRKEVQPKTIEIKAEPPVKKPAPPLHADPGLFPGRQPVACRRCLARRAAALRCRLQHHDRIGLPERLRPPRLSPVRCHGSEKFLPAQPPSRRSHLLAGDVGPFH